MLVLDVPRRPARRLVGAALACVFLILVAGRSAAVEAGDKAPAFSGRSLDGGGTLALDAYRGKVVLVDFWASWCGPCQTAMPLLEKLRQEFPSSDFEILAVNVDQDLEKAKKLVTKHKVGYRSVSDPNGQLPNAFGLKTMPTSYLIDRTGVVRLVHPGFRAGDIASLRQEIRRLLEAKR